MVKVFAALMGMTLLGGVAFCQSSMESIEVSFAPVGRAEAGALKVTLLVDTKSMELKSVEIRKGYEGVVSVVSASEKAGALTIVNSTLKNDKEIEAYYYSYSLSDARVSTTDQRGNQVGQANADERAYVLKIVALYQEIKHDLGDLSHISALANQFM